MRPAKNRKHVGSMCRKPPKGTARGLSAGGAHRQHIQFEGNTCFWYLLVLIGFNHL